MTAGGSAQPNPENKKFPMRKDPRTLHGSKGEEIGPPLPFDRLCLVPPPGLVVVPAAGAVLVISTLFTWNKRVVLSCLKKRKERRKVF